MLDDIFVAIIDVFNTTIAELFPQHNAIFVVIACFLFLSYIGKRTTLYQKILLKNYAKLQATFFPADKLPEGLHINGLTDSHRRNLNKYIKKKDTLRLAMFFATHQPSLYDVNSISKNAEDRPELFNALNDSDIHSIQEYNKISRKLINKKFMSKFGNLLFMENFIMYNHLCRAKPAVFHIPVNSDLRYMFETFVKTGLASQGLSVSLEDRLHILNLKELQAIADAIKINQSFTNIQYAAATLAKSPLTVVRLAEKYASDDLFLLKQENWDLTAIKKEWSAYNAYAKLLCA